MRWTRRITRFTRRNRAIVAIAVATALISSGTAAAATAFMLGVSNTVGTTTTLNSGVNAAVLRVNNTNGTGGTSARGITINVPAGREPILVNSSAGKATNLNADKVDGRDAAYFGRVRQFRGTVNTVTPKTTMLTFEGITISREVYILGDNKLRCQLYVSTAADGHITGFAAGTGTITVGEDTPVTNFQMGLATEANPNIIGHFVVVNRTTSRVVTATVALYRWPNNAGCEWHGTVSAAP